MTANPHDDLRFSGIWLSLACIYWNKAGLTIHDNREDIVKWLLAYDPGGAFPAAKVGGLSLLVMPFTLVERSVLADTLEARAMGIRWDEVEQANRMEPIGVITCELRPWADGKTTALLAWGWEVWHWCENWLAWLVHAMDNRWPGVAAQVAEAARAQVAEEVPTAQAAEEAAAVATEEVAKPDVPRRRAVTEEAVIAAYVDFVAREHRRPMQEELARLMCVSCKTIGRIARDRRQSGYPWPPT